MTRKSPKTGMLIDAALVASLIGFFAVVLNRDAIAAPLATLLLVGFAVLASVISLKREAHKESQLDEIELAGASFGARWSVGVIGLVALLLLFVAPAQDAIAGLADELSADQGAPMPVPAKLFLLGLVCAMAIQLIAKSALAAIWKWTKR